MENLKIGEDPLELNSLIKLIENSPSYHILLQNWRQFGRNLGVSELKLVDVSRQLRIGTKELHDISYDLLGLWKAETGNSATLQNLYNALVASHLREIAESLEKAFWLTAVKSITITLHDNDVKLGDILTENCPQHTFQRIYDALKLSPYTLPIQLLKPDVIPKSAATYYIERKLSYMTQIDHKIFKADLRNNVIVVKGISKHELAKLTGYQPVDLSGDQRDEISVRFMVLERDQDFQRICKKTDNPVHLIQHENGSFYWIKSNGGLETIKRFMNGVRTICGENEFMETSLSNRAQAICISDSPGMGKSFLLDNLAFKCKFKSESTVIVILLNEFVKDTQVINSPSAALAAISEYACITEVSKVLLKIILNNMQVDLFLDGYDEVEQLNVVDSFINHVKGFNNFRIFISTRPHFRCQLESVLNVISYEILPFEESDQIEFLTKYWTEYGAAPGERLENFARECLKTLNDQMTDTEKGIAGIPLQCKIFADVFAEEAERVSKENTESAKKIKIASLFDMYKKLVELKFRRITEYSRNRRRRGAARSNYINAHILLSITLIFPDWVEKFTPYLDGCHQVEENLLYSIGLVEKSAFMNSPKFVHRTFAEYILAEFLVSNLDKLCECVTITFGVIFGGEGINKDVKPWHRNSYSNEDIMKYPVMAYFINMHLTDRIKHSPLDKLATQLTKHRDKIKLEDVCKAIMACASLEFEGSLELSMNVFRNFNLGQRSSQSLNSIRDNYFKLLPHLVVQTYDKMTLIQKVVEFTKQVLHVDLNYHVLETKYAFSHPWIHGCTPIHVAVYYGKYNIVTYLVQEYGDQIKDLKYLLDVCIHNSSKNAESIIQDKETIISLLEEKTNEYSLNWFSETLQNCITKLVDNVHKRLLQRLVEGASKESKHKMTLCSPSSNRKDDFLRQENHKDSGDFHALQESDTSVRKVNIQRKMEAQVNDEHERSSLNTTSDTKSIEPFEDVSCINDKNHTTALLISGISIDRVAESFHLFLIICSSSVFAKTNHENQQGFKPLHQELKEYGKAFHHLELDTMEDDLPSSSFRLKMKTLGALPPRGEYEVARALKPICMFKSLKELQKEALQYRISETTCWKLIISAADDLFDEAEKNDLAGDEELAYFFYFRYANALLLVLYREDFQKYRDMIEKMLSKQKFLTAVAKVEVLGFSLIMRYALLRKTEAIANPSSKNSGSAPSSLFDLNGTESTSHPGVTNSSIKSQELKTESDEYK